MAPTPFYQNADVWIALFTFLAIILSQLPPIKLWFKKGKLELDVYSKGFLNHSLGSPLIQLHLIINNVGVKAVKIKKITTDIYVDDSLITSLSALNYVPNPSDNKTVILPTFNIEAKSEWSNITNFQQLLKREEEKIRRDISLIIQKKVSENTDTEQKEAVTVKNKVVKPLHKIFKENFIWEASRYKIDINIETDDIKTNLSKTIYFTIFETQSNELKAHQDGYSSGDTVYWNSGRFSGTYIDIE